MAVRKNQASLTPQEKSAFVAALLELKRRGRFDPYVTTHNTFIMNDNDNGERTAHRAPSFLPWHRSFLLRFERDLQLINPNVTLPYWDWTVDRTVDASLWGSDLLGGDGRASDGQVTTGPFAYSGGNWPLTVSPDSRNFLQRSLGKDVGELPTRAEVESVLAVQPYDAAPWNSSSTSGFRNQIEGWHGVNLHNRVHVWVGGSMGTGMSPNDPAFWLHHCFIDKIWAEWSLRHADHGYLPATATPNVVAFGDVMKPWNDTTPADMFNHLRYYRYDTRF
ncbi:tyrosinase family protein [Kitasatospora sp. NBC_00240]|uniref:tyrosinase MelC2 n=1 Tax=Kitasatospora sp. NBC_00240 TaxID=2903567 RepID=UPI002258930F|nr:tyrosinase family protein [Kitasatospora sp. NBC_00240]MCX5208394.1 tyrosinase family protein [Kitasatospora sp. NBC_00240]